MIFVSFALLSALLGWSLICVLAVSWDGKGGEIAAGQGPVEKAVPGVERIDDNSVENPAANPVGDPVVEKIGDDPVDNPVENPVDDSDSLDGGQPSSADRSGNENEVMKSVGDKDDNSGNGLLKSAFGVR